MKHFGKRVNILCFLTILQCYSSVGSTKLMCPKFIFMNYITPNIEDDEEKDICTNSSCQLNIDLTASIYVLKKKRSTHARLSLREWVKTLVSILQPSHLVSFAELQPVVQRYHSSLCLKSQCYSPYPLFSVHLFCTTQWSIHRPHSFLYIGLR